MTTLCPAVSEQIKRAFEEGYMCCYVKDEPCYHIGLKEGDKLRAEYERERVKKILFELEGKICEDLDEFYLCMKAELVQITDKPHNLGNRKEDLKSKIHQRFLEQEEKEK